MCMRTHRLRINVRTISWRNVIRREVGNDSDSFISYVACNLPMGQGVYLTRVEIRRLSSVPVVSPTRICDEMPPKE